MALTPTIEASQSFVNAVITEVTTNINVSQLYAQAVANFPTEGVEASTSFVSTITGGATPSVQTAQSYINVVCRGRVDDPKVRVWTYTLDGHDYYVLRLGNIETLVCDLTTGQWFEWTSNDNDVWKAFTGINWQSSGKLAEDYGSNVIVGDDGNGSLYFLNPNQFTDDDRVEGSLVPRTFTREFQGQAVKRGYDHEKVFAVELLGSIGKMDNADLTTISLSYSDDEGETYIDAGSVTIPNNAFSKRVDWRSLGSLTAPGRLFKITDTGALQRIDNLTLDTDREG